MHRALVVFCLSSLWFSDFLFTHLSGPSNCLQCNHCDPVTVQRCNDNKPGLIALMCGPPQRAFGRFGKLGAC